MEKHAKFKDELGLDDGSSVGSSKQEKEEDINLDEVSKKLLKLYYCPV